MPHFADRLAAATRAKGNPLCVGLDPRWESLPREVRERHGRDSLAAIALEMSKVGKPPEIHFGWAEEGALEASVGFVLFGQGNVPWLVRELIRKAEPDPERRPRVVIG